MADGTRIEWSDASWNPIRARVGNRIGWHCEIITPGCEGCYAQAINHRLGTGDDYLKKSRRAEIFIDEKMLAQPLHWRRPRRIFVCSMSDLFGEWVPDEMIDRVFAIMALAPQHTFQVLTKRAERMRRYIADRSDGCGYWEHWEKKMLRERSGDPGKLVLIGKTLAGTWPWPHCWLGVSVEDQRRAEERIPALMETPAALRWVSAEPLLSQVNLHWIAGRRHNGLDALRGETEECDSGDLITGARLDWVVCGGESGPGARPMDLAWARSLVAQCRDAGVAVFVKQLGTHPYGSGFLALRDRKGGDPAEWPEDLWVREYPATDIRVRSPACGEREKENAEDAG